MRTAHFFQRLNHFPGMCSIYNKDTLASNLKRMQSLCLNEYHFFPTTWILHQDYQEIVRYFASNSHAHLIVKPSVGSQGCGIYLAHDINYIDQRSNCVVQQYIKNPMLLDGYKFDLRVYVLVLSCDPLRIFLYRDGLVRLCTVPYEEPTKENSEISYMHLTNYSLNKTSGSFVENDMQSQDGGSKRTISWLMECLRCQGKDVSELWRKIADIIVKTLITAQPTLVNSVKLSRGSSKNNNPLTCFEVYMNSDYIRRKQYVCILTFFFLPIHCILSRQLLGFDIILRADMEPFLLEVNHSPSFHTPSEVDASVKLPLLRDTLTMLNVQPLHRRALARRISEQVQCRLYGDTFDSSQRTRHIDDDSDDDSPGCGEKQNSSAKARRAAVPPLPTLLTASWAWEMHLQSEASHLSEGKFDLIYPADVYESQPTAGLQSLYERLIHASQMGHLVSVQHKV